MNGAGGRWPQILHHSCYAPPLGAGSVVLDLGASTAGFSHAPAARLGCPCHAVEAPAENRAAIAETDRVPKHRYAVTRTDGAVPRNAGGLRRIAERAISTPSAAG